MLFFFLSVAASALGKTTSMSGSTCDTAILWARKDRQSRGGGVLIGTASHISSSFLYSQSDPDVLTVKLFLSSPIVICAVYIPPSATVDLQDSLLLYLRGLYTSSDVPVVVPQELLGDFNCPDIEWSLLSASSCFSSLLCELVYDLNLSQLVAQPTHTKGNILDFILTNAEDRITDVAVLQSTFSSSDHFPVSFSF